MEGFKLVFSQPYLLGIFSSIMIYEIIITLFDFRFKVLIAEDITNLISLNNIETALQGVYKTTKMNEWVGFMGEWQSILGISSYMFGLSQFARWIGLSKSLMILPILLGIVAVFVGGSKSVFVAAVAMIIAKGLNYAFYQPIKEQLSIPTSKEAKYKSKAFIDMFGSRSSKAIGSLVNMIKEWAPYAFPIISLASSLGLILIWLLIALYLGKTFNKAVAKNEVVC